MENRDPLTLQTIVHQMPGFYLGEVDGDCILMSVKTGEIHSLTWVAAMIWEKLETPAPLQTVQAWLMNEFELGARESEADLLSVCETMLAHNTLTIA